MPEYQNATLNDLIKIRDLLWMKNGIREEDFDKAMEMLDQLIDELKADE